MSYIKINKRNTRKNKRNTRKNTRKNKTGGGPTTEIMRKITGQPDAKGILHYFKKPFRQIGLFKERLGDPINERNKKILATPVPKVSMPRSFSSKSSLSDRSSK